MKKRLLKKICLLVGTVLIAFTILIPSKSYAEELDVEPEIEIDLPYELVSDAYCTLSISSGNATISSSVSGKYGTTSTSITVYLEKLVYGTWQSFTSWTHNGGRNQNNTDTAYLGSGVFRVWMSVTATNSNGSSESFNVDGNVAGH